MLTDLITAIAQADPIIIHRHINPDPDAFGSQMGLKALIHHQFPQKQVFAVGESEPNLNWIGRPDVIADSTYRQALVIVIDTANTARIADDRYTSGTALMKIDHHPDREPFGDISYVDTNASSSSEIVADLAQAAHWALTPAVARCLYAGILGDTGRFMFDLTTPKTLRVAADLMAQGIDAPAIARAEDQLTPNLAQLIGYALQHTQVTDAGAGSFILSTDQRERFGVPLGMEQIAVNYVGKLTTIDAWIMFTQRLDGQYRCELRSKHHPINQLAVAFGGGGHPLASGAVAKDLATCQAMIKALNDLLKEQPK
ncbi:DHH family phosphoesterase [Lacticaseibacillus sp. N501-2]|uniref:DHH family phosphoesterase n=1 Tax=Lacticaseibacillus salsurae TaxID=3367729 RepID=UPI0038B2F35C